MTGVPGGIDPGAIGVTQSGQTMGWTQASGAGRILVAGLSCGGAGLLRQGGRRSHADPPRVPACPERPLGRRSRRPPAARAAEEVGDADRR